jgi:hypothetical protein
MIVNGLSYITSDELHVYEEGINSDAERLYLNWGEPRGRADHGHGQGAGQRWAPWRADPSQCGGPHAHFVKLVWRAAYLSRCAMGLAEALAS